MAPLIWFGLFVIASAAALLWGLLALMGLVAVGVAAISVVVTRGAGRPVSFWLIQVTWAVVGLALLGYALNQT